MLQNWAQTFRKYSWNIIFPFENPLCYHQYFISYKLLPYKINEQNVVRSDNFIQLPNWWWLGAGWDGEIFKWCNMKGSSWGPVWPGAITSCKYKCISSSGLLAEFLLMIYISMLLVSISYIGNAWKYNQRIFGRRYQICIFQLWVRGFSSVFCWQWPQEYKARSNLEFAQNQVQESIYHLTLSQHHRL